MAGDAEDIRAFLRRTGAVAQVSVERVEGSAPRDAGTWMLVSAEGQFLTIGGGALEHRAIATARAMLAEGADRLDLALPLGPEIGQCCGGRVTLTITRLSDAGRAALAVEHDAALAARPGVYVFGAGHVGAALARALCLLPVRAVLVDSRAGMLGALPDDVEAVLTAIPEAVVRDAPPQSAFVVMTHDHATDFLITREALARGDAAYVGMIGSATKRGAFRGWLRRTEEERIDIGALVCPIGGHGTADKRPAVIASLVAAEVMARLSGLEATATAPGDDVMATAPVSHARR